MTKSYGDSAIAQAVEAGIAGVTALGLKVIPQFFPVIPIPREDSRDCAVALPFPMRYSFAQAHKDFATLGGGAGVIITFILRVADPDKPEQMAAFEKWTAERDAEFRAGALC